jgi:L-threonylcarbamoyladenylate synthase
VSGLDEAVAALERGQVVGVPTDTVYGLGVDPWNEEAVRALYELKGRPHNKPIGLLAASAEQAAQVGRLDVAGSLLEHWPGALTLVVRTRVVVPSWVGDSAVGTVGIRVPDHSLLRELLGRSGPLAVTSANLAGDPEALDDESAREIFGDRVAVYVEGKSLGATPSTVVDITQGEVRLLRAGPVVIDEGA